jgi:hypothetical protein
MNPNRMRNIGVMNWFCTIICALKHISTIYLKVDKLIGIWSLGKPPSIIKASIMTLAKLLFLGPLNAQAKKM